MNVVLRLMESAVKFVWLVVVVLVGSLGGVQSHLHVQLGLGFDNPS